MAPLDGGAQRLLAGGEVAVPAREEFQPIFEAGEELLEGALTLEVVREVLAEVVERRADPHLSYVDGLALYGPADAERLPLPDNLHPDTATHALIGERFAALGDW